MRELIWRIELSIMFALKLRHWGSVALVRGWQLANGLTWEEIRAYGFKNPREQLRAELSVWGD